MSGAFIAGLALLVVGYALAYYAMTVLVWSRSDATEDPVPLAKCLGF